MFFLEYPNRYWLIEFMLKVRDIINLNEKIKFVDLNAQYKSTKEKLTFQLKHVLKTLILLMVIV